MKSYRFNPVTTKKDKVLNIVYRILLVLSIFVWLAALIIISIQ